MRENCTYGSEGGAVEANRPSLPLSKPQGQRSAALGNRAPMILALKGRPTCDPPVHACFSRSTNRRLAHIAPFQGFLVRGVLQTQGGAALALG